MFLLLSLFQVLSYLSFGDDNKRDEYTQKTRQNKEMRKKLSAFVYAKKFKTAPVHQNKNDVDFRSDIYNNKPKRKK